jgi:hypothetical protein
MLSTTIFLGHRPGLCLFGKVKAGLIGRCIPHDDLLIQVTALFECISDHKLNRVCQNRELNPQWMGVRPDECLWC